MPFKTLFLDLKKRLQPLIVTAGRNVNVKRWSLEIMQRGNNCFLVF